MFKQKKDRQVLELTIEFNLTAISKWLKDGGEIENVEKIKNDWKSCLIRHYNIDVLPKGQAGDIYFHREKNIISNNVGGIDFLGDIERFKKGTSVGFDKIGDNAERFLKEYGISILSWERWREFIILYANNINILTAPVTEFGIIMSGDKIACNRKFGKPEESIVKVPTSFGEDDEPGDFIEVIRRTSSSNSVGYSNAFGSVSASALNHEVEYDRDYESGV